MEEYAREPCPYRIVDDCGGAFAMGCIGGGVFQAIKGFRNAPSGFNRRMVCNGLGQINYCPKNIRLASLLCRLAV